ncbi:MAG: GLPGLI family protein [Bacteroidota bacterium]
MKNLIIASALFFLSISLGLSQNTADKLRISYIGNSASDFITNTVKKQVSDENELSYVLYLMTESKVYYSLYIDSKNNSSFFSLDSTRILPGVTTSGYFHTVVKNSEQTYGMEYFMDSEVEFSGNIDELEWEFTNESKTILGYECKKANLTNAPGYYAWFATKLPFNDGPGFYKGLPGLVLEVNTPFEFITTASIEPISKEEFPDQNQIASVSDKNSTTIEAMFAKKDNFRRTIIAGK